jgi:anti-sigma regulatory factor (Ser/Thr protein kinase)
MHREFTLVNRLDALIAFNEQIEAYADEVTLPPDVLMHLELVLEEILTNVINYAYEDDKEHEIHVCADYSDSLLRMKISDDGMAFDPTKQEAPDVQAGIEDRKIGGLGIFLVGKLMDSVAYKREQGRNILIIEKKVSL